MARFYAYSPRIIDRSLSVTLAMMALFADVSSNTKCHVSAPTFSPPKTHSGTSDSERLDASNDDITESRYASQVFDPHDREPWYIIVAPSIRHERSSGNGTATLATGQNVTPVPAWNLLRQSRNTSKTLISRVVCPKTLSNR